MAAFLNVCRFNPTAGGTTDWTYSTAVTGYQSPAAAGVVNGTLYKYRAESSDLSQWELGEGAYNTGTGVLARTTVLYNSSGTGTGAGQTGAGSKINFSAAPQVAVVELKEDLLSVTEANSFTTAKQEQARINIGVVPTYGLTNHSIAVSAAASALTISLKDRAGSDPSSTSPVVGQFRSPTGTTGSWVERSVTGSLSLVLSSGSTLGVTSSTAFRLWVVLFDDGGTMRLGAINCSTAKQVFPLTESIPASSTAEGGAGGADSAGVFYTGTAVTSKSYLIVGYVEWSASGLTAGTWTTTNVNYVQSFGPGIKKPGDVVGSVYYVTGEAATGTTTVPVDDTIPQSSEGDQFMSQAYTPTSAANLLLVDAQAALVTSAQGAIAMSLFQDSNANSLATGVLSVLPSVWGVAHIKYMARSQLSSSTTFKIRAGNNAAGTTAINASTAGTRYYGGVFNSYIDIKELMG